MDFPERQAVPLWNGPAPLAQGEDAADIPTITIFRPTFGKKNRKSVVILPGGAYAMLAPHEGQAYAGWLADHGYTAFVVKYRLGPKYHHPAEISDAARAIRVVRANAAALGLHPDKIGIMGSSAGGHLAASCATFHEEGLRQQDEPQDKNLGRPDFSILCYPVISSVEGIGHLGSFYNLIGQDAPRELFEKLSMDRSVTPDTPPAFIWHTFEDNCVPVQNSLLYANALNQFKIPFELHIYEQGCHGIGLNDGHPWCAECLRWLESL